MERKARLTVKLEDRVARSHPKRHLQNPHRKTCRFSELHHLDIIHSIKPFSPSQSSQYILKCVHHKYSVCTYTFDLFARSDAYVRFVSVPVSRSKRCLTELQNKPTLLCIYKTESKCLLRTHPSFSQFFAVHSLNHKLQTEGWIQVLNYNEAQSQMILCFNTYSAEDALLFIT